ncbi:poly-gamma-glutamate synthesis protein (capsule biosynthesis protein) [Arthrobacter crystallopoietes]|uniref:Poly-gamma-glutamate synthesis protein (Capsule biosynthesis protein) n=2 Tax=Crystallibacter crystallopoietes TaxID=37928 RepID=A0A1H1AK47_9MICC|nr:poly-gamma-glutamate synthesis protein (capsule biosynthesis protein) [Arthrobacter crystallopoietes]
MVLDRPWERVALMASDTIKLFLAGDVMTGRGIDQILPSPGSPKLREGYIRNARDYVALAEAANGPIPRPVEPDWPWGDALEIIGEAAPDARVVNLETSITNDGDFAPRKGIHYRMRPDNIACLTIAGIDVCVLANNHVLDFGVAGLTDTVDVLHGIGIRTAGAGRDAQEAWNPAVLSTGHGRMLIWSAGLESSGISPANAAGDHRPGVALLPDLSADSAALIIERVHAAKREGDLAVASLHWGSNWGYAVPRGQVQFAHRLIDGGIDIVHGHSSHHPRPIEVYRGQPILYGCGDLINDYEGISGYEQFRDDLRLLYFVTVDTRTRELHELRLVPMRSRRMRLERATGDDAAWLHRVLGDASSSFGTTISLANDGTMTAR